MRAGPAGGVNFQSIAALVRLVVRPASTRAKVVCAAGLSIELHLSRGTLTACRENRAEASSTADRKDGLRQLAHAVHRRACHGEKVCLPLSQSEQEYILVAMQVVAVCRANYAVLTGVAFTQAAERGRRISGFVSVIVGYRQRGGNSESLEARMLAAVRAVDPHAPAAGIAGVVELVVDLGTRDDRNDARIGMGGAVGISKGQRIAGLEVAAEDLHRVVDGIGRVIGRRH